MDANVSPVAIVCRRGPATTRSDRRSRELAGDLSPLEGRSRAPLSILAAEIGDSLQPAWASIGSRRGVRYFAAAPADAVGNGGRSESALSLPAGTGRCSEAAGVGCPSLAGGAAIGPVCGPTGFSPGPTARPDRGSPRTVGASIGGWAGRPGFAGASAGLSRPRPAIHCRNEVQRRRGGGAGGAGEEPAAASVIGVPAATVPADAVVAG
jgi:hypothetical protein